MVSLIVDQSDFVDRRRVGLYVKALQEIHRSCSVMVKLSVNHPIIYFSLNFLDKSSLRLF